jgi:hypothetical protein
VQVEIETILHGGTVDLGDETAGLREFTAVEADPIPDRNEFARRLSRVSPAPAADVDAELLSGVSPRLSAPMTLVVMPEECQSIPMTAPKD